MAHYWLMAPAEEPSYYCTGPGEFTPVLGPALRSVGPWYCFLSKARAAKWARTQLLDRYSIVFVVSERNDVTTIVDRISRRRRS